MTGNSSNFWEWKFQQNLFLVIYDVNSGPIDGNDDIVFGQIGTRVSESFVKSRKEQWPLVLCVADNVFFDFMHNYSVFDVVTLWMQNNKIIRKLQFDFFYLCMLKQKRTWIENHPKRSHLQKIIFWYFFKYWKKLENSQKLKIHKINKINILFFSNIGI